MPQAASRTAFPLAAFAAALLAALVLAPGRAEAGISSCTVESSGIAFSAYNSQTKDAVDGTGTITVSCSGDGATNSLSINLTGGHLNSCSSRQMRNPAANGLNYQIFREATRVNNFCDGGSRLDFNMDLSATGSQTRVFTMYGRVLAAQNPVYSTAAYTDTLAIAVKRGGNTVASTSTTISGSVAAICSVSAGTLGFGSYSGSVVDAVATVTVNCSNGAPYQVGMGGGASPSGSLRRMAGPAGNYLAYQLYANALRTIAWGDGSAQLGPRRGGTGSGAAQSLAVYGRVPAGQSPAAGSYADSVVVTVEY